MAAQPWLLTRRPGHERAQGRRRRRVRRDPRQHARRASRPQLGTDGAVEQDTAQWWDGIRAGARELVGSGAVDPGSVVGVGITGQYASTVPVGADGEAVGPCLTWADDRGGAARAADVRRGRGRLQADRDRAVAALHRGRPLAGRRRPQRPRAVPQARAPRRVRPHEGPARAAGLRRPAPDRASGRDAGVDGGVVAHRQPARRSDGVRARARARGRARLATGCPSCCRPGRSSDRSRPRVAAELGLPRRRPGRHRRARPARGVHRLRSRRGLRRAHHDQHDVVGLVRAAVQEDRRAAPDRVRARACGLAST